MFQRRSPRFNSTEAASMQKKVLSPKISEMKKTPTEGITFTCVHVSQLLVSSFIAARITSFFPVIDCCPRASWNAGLEKALVDLLHEHNNERYRSQNGWSSEAWNRIVKLFHKRFSYVSFTKLQIQEKERELKDYKFLKEARRQSGVHWNEKQCRIEVEEPIWDNIIHVS